jgi:hypothetical protein
VNVAVLQLSMTAGPGGAVRVESITFTEGGTGDEQTDLGLVALYVDADADGAYSASVDTVLLASVAGGYPAAGTLTFPAVDRIIGASSSESWILVYTFTGSASTGDTFDASVASVSDVTAESTASGLPTTVSGPPVNSNTLTVQNIGSLSLSLGGTTPPAANLPFPPTGVDMFQLRLDPAATEDIDVSAITFTAGGTGNADADISSVVLYNDLDGSGTVTGGDVQIGGAGTFTGGTITYGGLAETLTAGNPETWLIVCDFTGGSGGDTYSVNVASNNDVTATGAVSTVAIVPTGAPVNGFFMTQPVVGTLTVAAGTNDPVAGNIANPPVNAPMLQLNLEAGMAENVVVSQLVLTAGGTGNANADISSVDLYEDVDGSGTLTGGDVQIGASTTFSGGTASFGGLSETIVSGAFNAEDWLVVCTFTGGTSGDTYSVSLAQAADLNATGAFSTVPITPAGPPIWGNDQTLQVGTLTLAQGLNNPIAGPLPVPMNNVPMLQVRLEAGAGEDVNVSAITFTAGGTGNADADISVVDLWNDLDASGTLTGGDVAIGSPGTFSAGTVTFSGLSETITAGALNWETWLVVCTFSGGSGGSTYSVSLANPTDVTATGAVSTYAVTPTGSAAGNLQTMPAPPLVITTQRLPFGLNGGAYNFALQATGGTTPYTWSVTGGSLPTGLNLAPATGVISGTPTALGSIFTVTVTDSGGPAQNDTQDLAIEVDPAGSTLVSVIQGGGGNFTTIGAAIAAIPNPLANNHIIEIQDNATYNENVDISYTPQGGSGAAVMLRSKYDNLPTIFATNPNDHAIDVQSPSVSLWGLQITGATGASMSGVHAVVGLLFLDVRNCVIYGNDVAIDNSGNSGNNFINNTCYGVKGLFVGGGGSTMVRNNIVWATGAWAVQWYSPGAFSSDFNLLYAPNGAVGYDGTSFYNTLAAWQTFSGVDQNSQSGDPNFVNLSGADFHLTTASTLAIDMGMTATWMYTDAEGYARNQGSGWDIGAFEKH